MDRSPAAPERVQTFAVMLNINAKGVNKKVRQSILKLVPEEDLFISGSREEAEAHAATIIKRRYDGVFSGGGDGSLVMLINTLWKIVVTLNNEQAAETSRNRKKSREQPLPYSFPKLGILKMGTGNGWAGVVGSQRGLEQLEHTLSGGELKFRPFDLIEVEGRKAHFSGIGWDALVLNDYIEMKKLGTSFPFLKPYLTSVAGYFTTAFVRSIPKDLAQRVLPTGRVKVNVFNNGPRVFRIEEGGRPVPVRFGRGDMIFHGSMNFLGVATTANYGFGLKIFPYAMTMPGMMHLRIMQADLPEIFANLGSIWDGTYRSPTFHDFLVSDIEIQASHPTPFQIGGDAEGLREVVRFRISSESVEVLDFLHLNKLPFIPFS